MLSHIAVCCPRGIRGQRVLKGFIGHLCLDASFSLLSNLVADHGLIWPRVPLPFLRDRALGGCGSSEFNQLFRLKKSN